MNTIVKDLLNLRLTGTEDLISAERSWFSSLTRQLETSGRKLDALNQEKRAIKNHLEASA